MDEVQRIGFLGAGRDGYCVSAVTSRSFVPASVSREPIGSG